VIRKINTKNDLMCPIVGFLFFQGRSSEMGEYAVNLDLAGVYGDLRA
jgi:hypothetical protein